MGFWLLRPSMLGIPETAARCPSPTFLTEDKLLGVGRELPVIGQARIGSTPRTTLHGKGSSVRHKLLSKLLRSVSVCQVVARMSGLCEVAALKGETKARARAAQDYGNRIDRPVNTCENLVSRRLRLRHRSFFSLAFLASGKSDFSSPHPFDCFLGDSLS
ncbi:uncharacterized protein LOC112466116 isoform X2 [Temnothorax curvispinosus]|uniref:Uncharacterized protein LOC112466116 isoform X2 n=1 Tax=Temnothorax curvispinosus TaxID=300111 RepID=A0A6J1R591_9HYME|nr:uncharacterized protein LOC112466116 isoform X2 [Temnothorax curvispinosus]